jgi:hypothetical protein
VVVGERLTARDLRLLRQSRAENVLGGLQVLGRCPVAFLVRLRPVGRQSCQDRGEALSADRGYQFEQRIVKAPDTDCAWLGAAVTAEPANRIAIARSDVVIGGSSWAITVSP